MTQAMRFYAFAECTLIDSAYGISNTPNNVPIDSAYKEFKKFQDAKKDVLSEIDRQIAFLKIERKRIASIKKGDVR